MTYDRKHATRRGGVLCRPDQEPGSVPDPAHRRERPRSAPRQMSSAPFKGRSRLCAGEKGSARLLVRTMKQFLRVASLRSCQDRT